jgi:transcriptional regulator with XRE-family HTH domain
MAYLLALLYAIIWHKSIANWGEIMFKDRLRATRCARGYTLQAVADHLSTGLRNYQKYESGDARPTFEGLVMLADLFNVPVDFLLERDAYLASLGVSVDVSPEGPPKHPKPRLNR